MTDTPPIADRIWRVTPRKTEYFPIKFLYCLCHRWPVSALAPVARCGNCRTQPKPPTP